jgi:hypothetical protein
MVVVGGSEMDIDRQELVDQKAIEVQAMLRIWAHTVGILSPNEQLVFTLGIRDALTVVRQPIEVPENLLDMLIVDFFSRERIEAAGFPSKFMCAIIHNGFRNFEDPKEKRYRPFWMKSIGPLLKIRDLVDMPEEVRSRFFGEEHVRFFGSKKSKSKKIIKAVLNYNGIKV